MREPWRILKCWAQVEKIVGRGAPEEFVKQLEALARAHDEKLDLDVIRAYFFGARYMVEVPPLECRIDGIKSAELKR